MENIIPGIYVAPPPVRAAIVTSPHDFGYSSWVCASQLSKIKFEFLSLTKCRETITHTRKFIISYSGKTDIKFEWDGRPFFYSPTIPIELIALCFNYLENCIGVRAKATFQNTDEPNLIAIFPGQFWGSVALRFGLFTCLLRAFCKAAEKEHRSVSWSENLERWFYKALQNDCYLSATKDAVLKFINGNTFVVPIQYTGDWYIHMKDGANHCHLVDPTKFSHDQYMNYIKSYAYSAWELGDKMMVSDKDFWSLAEKYAALNACR